MTTVTQLGTATAANGISTTLVVNVLATVPVGSTIVLFASDASLNLTGVSDSQGNTYAIGPNTGSAGGEVQAFWCVGTTHALTIGTDTITATYSATTGTKQFTAVMVDATGAHDVSGVGTIATGTAPSIATGTLAQASEIIFGFGMVILGSADTYTESSGFTSNSTANLTGTSALRSGYRVVSSTASVTYAPTLGTSRAYRFNVISFKLGSANSKFLLLFRP